MGEIQLENPYFGSGLCFLVRDGTPGGERAKRLVVFDSFLNSLLTYFGFWIKS